MQQILDLRTADLPGPTYLSLGNFDGMHRGHCALLSTLKEVARRHPQSSTGGTDGTGRARTALLTFDPHPLAVLRPTVEHLLLTSPAERLLIAGQETIDFGIVQPFNREIAALSAPGFLALLKNHLGLAGLVVGPDFALGRNREGTLDRLRELGQEMDYRVHVLSPIDWQGRTVRSSVIREYLRAGDVAAAWELLGRLYHATGTVIEGDKRGRLLGTPTANLQLADEKLWPGNGVYATRAWVLRDGQPQAYQSVSNLGVRPTVDGTQRRFETHILDFPPAGRDGDLYGQQITVEFVARLRGEIRFNGLEELQAQIQADIDAARTLFAATELPATCAFVGNGLQGPHEHSTGAQVINAGDAETPDKIDVENDDEVGDSVGHRPGDVATSMTGY